MINWIVAGSNVFCAIVCIALSIPLLRGRVKMNSWYGVRFAKSFESDEAWYDINRFGAQRMILWSVVIAAIGVGCLFVDFTGREWLVVLFACAPMLYLVSAIESYRYAQRR